MIQPKQYEAMASARSRTLAFKNQIDSTFADAALPHESNMRLHEAFIDPSQ
jgi:hypothetical protein